MARYALEFAPTALRSLRKLDQAAARRIRTATEALRDKPRPPGALPVKSMPGILRIRSGDYRILYQVDDERLIVLVVDAGHRSTIYGGH